MKKKDFLLIGIVLIAVLALFLLTGLPRAAASKGEIVIYIGSDVYRRVPLGEPQTVVIDQGGGKVNELYITEDGAVMHAATCDNQDCIKQGEVTLGNYQSRVLGSWIICLPNQVSVELVAGEEQ
ncbi:MAG TPA: NusG domain II-containing protein [Feifaniaceae bacterium]|nr:NusG domain II-containing protein [Feifaniaceae bacterium]